MPLCLLRPPAMNFTEIIVIKFWPLLLTLDMTRTEPNTKRIWLIIFQFYDNGYFAGLQFGMLSKTIIDARRVDYSKCYQFHVKAWCARVEGKMRQQKRLRDEDDARERAHRAARAAQPGTPTYLS